MPQAQATPFIDGHSDTNSEMDYDDDDGDDEGE